VMFYVNSDPTTGAFATWAVAGGNTATTNASGIATSGVLNANGVAGNYSVEAWTPAKQSGGIGPAIFGCANQKAGVAQNVVAIQTAWTTYKAHEATLITDLQNLINTDLTNIEADRAALAGLGANDLVDLIKKRIGSLCADNLPAIVTGDGAPVQLVKVFAPLGAPVTLSVTGHSTAPPPVTQTPSGQICFLT